MTAPLAVQLYSLGATAAADTAGAVARLADMGFVGVEPVLPVDVPDPMRAWVEQMGVELPPPVDVDVLKRALDEHGMVVSSTHVPLPEGETAGAVLDLHEMLGTRLLVVPALFDEEAGALEAFDDLDRIKRLAERFNTAAELARPRGMRIGYHNHSWEFGADFDGRSGLEVFFDLTEPDVFAEIDLYWAKVGGRDPLDLVQALGERVLLLHVKDGDGGLDTPSCALGSGVMDLPAVLAAATAAAWHIVELEGLAAPAIWPVLAASRRFLVDAGLSSTRSH